MNKIDKPMKCPACRETFPVVRGGVVQNGDATLYNLHLLEHAVVLLANVGKPRRRRTIRPAEEPHGD